MWGIAAAVAALVAVLGALIVRDRTDRDATTGARDRDIVQVTAVPTTNAPAGRTAPPAVLPDALSASATLAAISTTIADGAAAASITEPQAEAFLHAYFDAVNSGSYEWSWSQLAPEFQRSKARSYDYYVGFWNDNDVEVGDVRLVDATADGTASSTST